MGFRRKKSIWGGLETNRVRIEGKCGFLLPAEGRTCCCLMCRGEPSDVHHDHLPICQIDYEDNICVFMSSYHVRISPLNPHRHDRDSQGGDLCELKNPRLRGPLAQGALSPAAASPPSLVKQPKLPALGPLRHRPAPHSNGPPSAGSTIHGDLVPTAQATVCPAPQLPPLCPWGRDTSSNYVLLSVTGHMYWVEWIHQVTKIAA